jgi:hypothetical protein
MACFANWKLSMMYFLIIFIGFLLVLAFLIPLCRFFIMRPYLEAEIEDLDVSIVHKKEYAMAPMDHIFVVVKYSYRVSGATLESNRISIMGKGRFLSEDKAKRFRQDLCEKKICYYSKRRPGFSILYKKLWVAEKDTRAAVLVAGVALVTVGYIGLSLG